MVEFLSLSTEQNGLRHRVPVQRVKLRSCSEAEIICAEVVGPPKRRQFDLGLKKSWVNGRYDIHCHFVLQSENVAQITFKSICPKMYP